jgi:hypothetical protein
VGRIVDTASAAVPAWLDLNALTEAGEQAAHLLEAVHDHAEEAARLVRRGSEALPDLPDDVHRTVRVWLGLEELAAAWAVIATLASGPGGGTAFDGTVRALVERYGLER